jgi:hypothetical protein
MLTYRGFEVRENRKTMMWQAIRPTDLTWEDGFTAPDRFALKAVIDACRDSQTANPWQLPCQQRQPIAA